MKKLVLLGVIALSFGLAQQAQAQAALVHLMGAGVGLGVRAATKPKLTAEEKAAQRAAAQAADTKANSELSTPTTLHTQRTAADQLPKKGAEQITALEAELERCHAAMLASATGTVCTPEQRTAIQQAAVAVAKANHTWDLRPYQQEMAFYQAEDARRQAAATPANQ